MNKALNKKIKDDNTELRKGGKHEKN